LTLEEVRMAERVYVDRIEGDRAVLLFGDEGRESGSVPAWLLPPGTREGAALDLLLTPAANDRKRREVEELLEDLFGEEA
jgi:hypothetical protein